MSKEISPGANMSITVVVAKDCPYCKEFRKEVESLKGKIKCKFKFIGASKTSVHAVPTAIINGKEVNAWTALDRCKQ